MATNNSNKIKKLCQTYGKTYAFLTAFPEVNAKLLEDFLAQKAEMKRKGESIWCETLGEARVVLFTQFIL